MKKIFLLLSIKALSYSQVFSQEGKQDWSQFNQSIDVANYRRGQFKVSAFVKVDASNPNVSQARLWARVDKKKGMGFFDNMYNRPITLNNEWREYSIEGPVDEKAEKLIVGGLYFGFGKYYYDKFELRIKKKDGDWEPVQILNNDFEGSDLKPWRMSNEGGFSYRIIDKGYEGKQALLVDGSSKISGGKFIEVNRIKIYYEFHGQGDTVLMLHGNGQSISAFKKQIPEFEKQFTVLAMDSRAQGYSSDDGQKITYDLMAEDVNSILDQLKIKNINVLGWSDGGNTGIILAMKHPDKVKKLATMGANLFNDQTSVDDKLNKEIKNMYDALMKQNIPCTDLRVRMTELLMNEPKINPDDLQLIRCPTLVMAGSKDAIKENHTKLIASKIKRSKLVIFEKSTHYAPQEIPERFNKMVMDFFQEK